MVHATPHGAAASGAAASGPRARHPGPRELWLFRACAVAIALHVLVNAFVAMEPGAQRSDHLLAAAVPLAAVGLALTRYQRMRAGARACMALLFGILSVVSAGVAIAATRSGGPPAAGTTGALLLVAGPTLVGLGVWLLWVSRRRDDRLGRRVTRRTLLGLAAVVALYWVVVPIGFAIVATENPRHPVPVVDLGRPHEDVTLRTSDGLELNAWHVRSQNGAAVVLFPRGWTTEQARMLVRHGYGVLMVDMRGYGDSQGDANAYGWGSTRDVDAAVGYLRGRPEVTPGRIGGLGLSVGGEQMIEAAGGNQLLRAVVSEGAGLRSARESFARVGPSPWELVAQLPQDLVMTWAVWVLSGDPPPPSLEDTVATIAPRALLLMFGADGQGGEAALNPAYFAAAGAPKELWEVPGAGHTAGLQAQPDEYERRVLAFLDQELSATDPPISP